MWLKGRRGGIQFKFYCLRKGTSKREKNRSFENLIAFGKSTSQRIYPKQRTHTTGKKRHKYGLNMLYIPWMVILSDHGIRKISFQNFDF